MQALPERTLKTEKRKRYPASRYLIVSQRFSFTILQGAGECHTCSEAGTCEGIGGKGASSIQWIGVD